MRGFTVQMGCFQQLKHCCRQKCHYIHATGKLNIIVVHTHIHTHVRNHLTRPHIEQKTVVNQLFAISTHDITTLSFVKETIHVIDAFSSRRHAAGLAHCQQIVKTKNTGRRWHNKAQVLVHVIAVLLMIDNVKKYVLENSASITLPFVLELWARIHESVITYDGHISSPGITELELGPSENSYSRARKRSVIVVLEVGGFHTGCLVTKRCTAHGRRVICPARQSSGE